MALDGEAHSCPNARAVAAAALRSRSLQALSLQLLHKAELKGMRQELVPGIDADLSLELTALDGLRVERKHGGTVRLKLCSGREHRAPHAVALCWPRRQQNGRFPRASPHEPRRAENY